MSVKTKKEVACNAKAMHPLRVLTDNRCFSIWAAYALFSAGLCGWLLISTAGWELTIGILAIPMFSLLCRFKAPPPRLFFNPFSGGDLLKPASAGGRMVTEAKSPRHLAERNKLAAKY
jgi:hypothetical protein